MGGRQTVLFLTGTVSALSAASQIPETGKYFNCKQPWLDSLRGLLSGLRRTLPTLAHDQKKTKKQKVFA